VAGFASRLELLGARTQLVVNGEEAVYLEPGVSAGRIHLRRGSNRFEAVVVDALGAPGSWRFELLEGVLPGTLRVIAGEGAPAGERAVQFRLRGVPGERVVFAVERSGRSEAEPREER
jgi:hypothetical protein